MLRPRTLRAAVLLFLVAGCAPMPGPGGEAGRYLVYFNEFSAHLSDDARNVVAEAARYAKENRVARIRIEGRASATGSRLANQYLTQTRTQVVADELQRDGIDPSAMTQEPLGQATATDTSVMDRRVDIVLLK